METTDRVSASQSYDSIEQKIIEILREFASEAHILKLSNRDWTQQIKRRIGSIGESRRYIVCTSGWREIWDGEWLYDLVWYKNDNDKCLIDIGLVMECEWSPDFKQLKYDFEKLLIVRSSHRLFIYEGPHYGDTVENTSNRLIDSVRRYPFSQPGDRYLFAAHDLTTGEFWPRLFVVT